MSTRDTDWLDTPEVPDLYTALDQIDRDRLTDMADCTAWTGDDATAREPALPPRALAYVRDRVGPGRYYASEAQAIAVALVAVNASRLANGIHPLMGWERSVVVTAGKQLYREQRADYQTTEVAA